MAKIKRTEKEGVAQTALSGDYHACKYCNGIAEGSYEDLLCENCRQTFGHALYSEL